MPRPCTDAPRSRAGCPNEQEAFMERARRDSVVSTAGERCPSDSRPPPDCAGGSNQFSRGVLVSAMRPPLSIAMYRETEMPRKARRMHCPCFSLSIS